jgi:phosphoserine phosphatase
MEKVTHPVAVGTDPTLGRIARERGWPVISLR